MSQREEIGDVREGQGVGESGVEKTLSTPEEIAQRRIVKVVRDGDGVPVAKDAKVSLSIDLPVGEKVSLSSLVESDPSKLFMNNAGGDAPAKKSSLLFSNIQFSADLFNNAPKAEAKQAEKVEKPEKAAKSEASSKQSKAVGEEAKPETEEKVNKPKSLFDFTPSSNVFGNLLKNPAGLFATGGPSIFSFNSNVPPTTLAEAKKDEGESDEEGYKEESAEIDESKVINDYVYDLPYTKLIEKPVLKYKRNSDEAIENCTCALEQYKQNQKVYLFIRSRQTKTILYQGQLMRGFSSAKAIGDKTQSLNLMVVEFKDQKSQPASIKVQFESAESGGEFLKVFEAKLTEL